MAFLCTNQSAPMLVEEEVPELPSTVATEKSTLPDITAE
jgi:hypothetical protein